MGPLASPGYRALSGAYWAEWVFFGAIKLLLWMVVMKSPEPCMSHSHPTMPNSPKVPYHLLWCLDPHRYISILQSRSKGSFLQPPSVLILFSSLPSISFPIHFSLSFPICHSCYQFLPLLSLLLMYTKLETFFLHFCIFNRHILTLFSKLFSVFSGLSQGSYPWTQIQPWYKTVWSLQSSSFIPELLHAQWQ